MRESKWAIFRYLGLVLLVLPGSAIETKDRFTWLMEVLPVLVGIPILWFTTNSSPLTPLTQVFPTIHMIIHMGGRHNTYVEVPLDFRIQEPFDLGRNPYDRLGHFAQGCVRPYL
jgi:putative membrane protein